MVRGVFFTLTSPILISQQEVLQVIWEAVRRLEANGIKVLSITSDGASSNRKFFRMHHDKNDPNTFMYKGLNLYSDDHRWVYFFSDPPHLLKTIRNCWCNSGSNGTRLMKVIYYYV